MMQEENYPIGIEPIPPDDPPETSQNISSGRTSSRNRKQLSVLIGLLIVASVIITALSSTIGVLCGTGNCHGGNPGGSRPGTPQFTNSPIATVTTRSSRAPSVVPSDAQWNVICSFLSIPDRTECQSTRAISVDASSSIEEVMATTIPTEVGLMTHLTFLMLCCNQFIGTIPTEIGLLTQLSLLGLSNNQLSGTIPSTLGNLVQLSYLYLYSNPQLTGIIPSTLDSNNGINMYVDCANIRCQYCKDATAPDGGCSRT